MNQNSNPMRRSHTELASERGDKRAFAANSVAILTCMDARIDPAKLFALREGQAQMIRNAGGRASSDAIRSLVMSYRVFGTREWLVVHHSQCGMALLSDDTSRELLESESRAARGRLSVRTKFMGSPETQPNAVIDWHTLRDTEHGVLADLQCIRRHPLVPAEIVIRGYVFDVETGRLIEVSRAPHSETPPLLAVG